MIIIVKTPPRSENENWFIVLVNRNCGILRKPLRLLASLSNRKLLKYVKNERTAKKVQQVRCSQEHLGEIRLWAREMKIAIENIMSLFFIIIPSNGIFSFCQKLKFKNFSTSNCNFANFYFPPQAQGKFFIVPHIVRPTPK